MSLLNGRLWNFSGYLPVTDETTQDCNFKFLNFGKALYPMSNKQIKYASVTFSER